jgi:hypothetical protein
VFFIGSFYTSPSSPLGVSRSGSQSISLARHSPLFAEVHLCDSVRVTGFKELTLGVEKNALCQFSPPDCRREVFGVSLQIEKEGGIVGVGNIVEYGEKGNCFDHRREDVVHRVFPL